MVGDDVEADLGEGAIELGLWRILGKVQLLLRLSLFNTNYLTFSIQ